MPWIHQCKILVTFTISNLAADSSEMNRNARKRISSRKNFTRTDVECTFFGKNFNSKFFQQTKSLKRDRWLKGVDLLWRRQTLSHHRAEAWPSGYGRSSWSEGHGFKSQHHILDGHFSHILVVKIVMFVCKDENKWKRGRGWPILNN